MRILIRAMMLSVWALTAPLLIAQDSMSTRFGELSIDKSGVLLFNRTPISPRIEASFRLRPSVRSPLYMLADLMTVSRCRQKRPQN
jgi:hypothetical protein